MKMKEYDKKTLHKLQKVELDILKDFIKICDENNLEYFGLAGTGIGVMRHKGFIPWDDDIDVGLLRDDYEKFLKIAEQELSDKYIVMNGRKNSNYPLMTTRLMKKGTKFREYTLKDIDCELGIFLDIYPLDYVSDCKFKFFKQGLKSFIFSKLIILRSIPFPYVPYTGIKKKIVYVITGMAYGCLCLFGISKKWLHRMCEQAMIENNAEESSRVTFFGDTTPYMEMINLKDLFPLKKMLFEDMYIKMPNNMDPYLTNLFGNYMEMPPVEKRKNHFPYELDFGE